MIPEVTKELGGSGTPKMQVGNVAKLMMKKLSVHIGSSLFLGGEMIRNNSGSVPKNRFQ